MGVRDYYDAYWAAETQPCYEPDNVLTGLIRTNVRGGGRCLDVGCGAGQSYAPLVARETTYVGVDVSAAAIELARAAGLDAHVISDAAQLPFGDESFDLAICVEVLEHLFSPHYAVQEIWRVLRPGGRLIASTPNIVYWRQRANLAAGAWNPLGDALALEQPWRDPHIRFFTPRTLQRMLQIAGFSEVRVGAHGGCLLDHLTTRPTNFGVSRAYRWAESRAPSLLGMTVHGVATK